MGAAKRSCPHKGVDFRSEADRAVDGGFRVRNVDAARARGLRPGGARHRRDHRLRHFCHYRRGRRAPCRPRGRHILRDRRRRRGACRALLRGDVGDDSGFRQRLHLHLRHHGRTRRLADRLGPDPGIPDRRVRRQRRLVRLRDRLLRQRHRRRTAGGLDQRAARLGRSGRGDRLERQLSEPSGRRRHAADHDGADLRHPRIGQAQCRHRLHQDLRAAGVHRRGRAPCGRGELAAVRAAERGRVRPLRHLPGGDGRLLRLYRLRRGFDGGAGVQAAAARPADRHHPIARDQHAVLHRRRAGPDRRSVLSGPCRAEPHRCRRRPDRVWLAADRRRYRRHRRPDVGDAGAALGAAAHLSRDGAGRAVPALGRPHASPAEDALCHDRDHGGGLRRRRRPAPSSAACCRSAS